MSETLVKVLSAEEATQLVGKYVYIPANAWECAYIPGEEYMADDNDKRIYVKYDPDWEEFHCVCDNQSATNAYNVSKQDVAEEFLTEWEHIAIPVETYQQMFGEPKEEELIAKEKDLHSEIIKEFYVPYTTQQLLDLPYGTEVYVDAIDQMVSGYWAGLSPADGVHIMTPIGQQKFMATGDAKALELDLGELEYFPGKAYFCQQSLIPDPKPEEDKELESKHINTAEFIKQLEGLSRKSSDHTTILTNITELLEEHQLHIKALVDRVEELEAINE
jgi:hypothetical protein